MVRAWMIALSCGLSAATETNPVTVTIAYEVDCPDCQDYFRDQLSTKFVRDAMAQDKSLTLELLPYGNAKAWNRCQHGQRECQRNMLDACLIQYTRNEEPYAALSVLLCMEHEFTIFKGADNHQVLTKCVEKSAFKVEKKTLLQRVYDTCYGTDGTGKEGRKLIEDMGRRTDPEHTYVPWVSINGVHSTQAEKDLRGAICSRYPKLVSCLGANGGPGPEAQKTEAPSNGGGFFGRLFSSLSFLSQKMTMSSKCWNGNMSEEYD